MTTFKPEVSSVTAQQDERVRIGLLFLAIVMSAFLALIHMAIVQSGYDCGYALVEKIWGQAEEIEQGLWAFMSLGVVVLPGAFGLAYGACCAHVGGTSKAWTRTPYILVTTIFAGLTMLICSGSQPDGSGCLWGILFESALSVICISMGVRLGRWAYSNLKTRVQAAKMFLWSLAGLLPFAIMNLVHGYMPLPGEIAGYFLSISAGSCIAAYLAKSKDRTAGIIAAIFAMLPIILANFLNLSSNILSCTLDSLEWRALASAVILNIVSLSAIGAGGAIAVVIRKKQLSCSRQLHASRRKF
jgi:hypothetical protein